MLIETYRAFQKNNGPINNKISKSPVGEFLAEAVAIVQAASGTMRGVYNDRRSIAVE